MKLSPLIILFFLAFSSFVQAGEIPSGQQLQREAESRTQKIDTASLVKMLDNELDMVLIDIRTAGEISNMGGSIKATQNVRIPRGWLEFRVQRHAISKDTPIVVYCGAGFRSPFAADTLQKMGYTNVKNYAEGYIGWNKAGLSIEP
jgi:rhodanese-related sulfurtransferase